MKTMKTPISLLFAMLGGMVAATLCSCNPISPDAGILKNAPRSVKYEHADQYIMGGTTLNQPVHDIDIAWLADSLIIEAYDGTQVSFYETASGVLDDNTTLYYRLEPNGDLSIQYAKSGYQIPKDDSTFHKQLHLLIPRSMKVDDLDVSAVGTSVVIRGIECKELSPELVAADVYIHDVKCHSLDADIVSSQLESHFTTLPDEIGMEAVASKVTFFVPENAGIDCEMDRVAAQFECDLPYFKRGTGHYVIGNQACEMDIDAVSSSVNIKVE